MKFVKDLIKKFQDKATDARAAQEEFNKNMEAAVAEHGLAAVSRAKNPSKLFPKNEG